MNRYLVQPLDLPADQAVLAINDARFAVTGSTAPGSVGKNGVVVAPGQPPIDVGASMGLLSTGNWSLNDISNTGIVLGEFEVLPSGRWDAFRYDLATGASEILVGLGSGFSTMCLADSGAFSSRERQEPISGSVPFQHVVVLADNSALTHD